MKPLMPPVKQGLCEEGRELVDLFRKQLRYLLGLKELLEVVEEFLKNPAG